MQMPSIRLPSLSAGNLFEDFPTRRVGLYALYTIVLFLIFLVINFPYRVLVTRILNNIDPEIAQVDIHDARLSPWRGLDLRGVTVRRADWSRLPIVEIPRGYLWPGLGGLMSGNLSKADFRGDLYGGGVKARWVGGEDVQRTILQVEDVQLARYPLLGEFFAEGQIFGLLSGFVEVEGRGDDLSAGRANGEIYLDRAGSEGLVYGGLKLLDLSFEETKVLFAVQNGRIEIEEIASSGPDVTITGNGQISLRQPLENSVLDLKLQIDAAADARDEVKGLITLLRAQAPAKRGGSESSINVAGTLRAPRLR